MKYRLFLLSPAFASLFLACTTTTIVTQTVAKDGGAPAVETSGNETPPDEPGEEPTTDGGADASRDAGRRSDASPPKADAGDGGGPRITGGKMTLTCPSSGFHQPPPVEIASVATSLLPRCSATTKACVANATTSQAYDACLQADTIPPVTSNGDTLDCMACDRTQGSYCLAWACQSEFAAYACCAQDKGEAACGALLQAVTSCAGSTGKTNFDACVNSLVGACFP